jgi:hypothetical protein
MLASEERFAEAAPALEAVAQLFEGLDFDLDAVWIRLHQARFLIKAGARGRGSAVTGSVKAGRALEKAMLERLEGFGAFGILSGALDGLALGVDSPFFGV